MTCAISGIDHVALTTPDLAAAAAFYCDVLEAGITHDFIIDDVVIARQFRLGGALLNIHQAGHRHSLVAARPTPGAADLCFGWNGPIETAVTHLHDHGITIEEGPVARVGRAGIPGLSIYFRDPDGNLLEFLSTAQCAPQRAASGRANPS